METAVLIVEGKSVPRVAIFTPAQRKPQAEDIPLASQKGTITPALHPAPQTLDWFKQGYSLVQKHRAMTIYDISTGVTWQATYINGYNHADIIPASPKDAKILENNAITGNVARRSIIVTISGVPYAASLYAVPHGLKNYSNYFNGVMCIHFADSKTHGTRKVDAGHQSAIIVALHTKLP